MNRQFVYFSTEASRGLGETLLRFCVERFWLKEDLSARFMESAVERCVVLWRIFHTHKTYVVAAFGCSYY